MGYCWVLDWVLKRWIDMKITDYTEEQLLKELLSRNKGAESPKRITLVSPHTEFLIGIGVDDCISINIDNDSLRVLMENY